VSANAKTQLIDTLTIFQSAPYSGGGARSLHGTIIAPPAAAKPTDVGVLILYRGSGVTINGGASQSDAGWSNILNFGGPSQLQFNIWTALISSLGASSTLSETQQTNGGVLVLLIYRYCNRPVGADISISNGGAAGTQPNTGAIAASDGVGDMLWILGEGAPGASAIKPSNSDLYASDFASGGLSVGRGPYNNVAGGGESAVGTPQTAEWGMAAGVLRQSAGGGPPGGIPLFSQMGVPTLTAWENFRNRTSRAPANDMLYRGVTGKHFA
jgi:hypothetical protein